MRFYDIRITNPETGAPIVPASLGGLGITSLLPSGAPNPAALQIEWDIPVFAFHTPSGNAFVRIWGIGLQQIGTAFDLNGSNIKVYGGMSKGLPLADPKQANLLISGSILQAFGNWIGLDQTIDLLLAPSTGTIDAPLNIVLNWRAGMPLSDALAATLKTAFPNAIQKIAVSPRLVANHDQPGFYQTLSQFADVIYSISKSLITDKSYPGVSISYDGSTMTVTDFTTPPKPIAIEFKDLIGQPTWIEPNTIQAKVVMRGDLKVSDIVTLPQGIITTTAGAQTRFQDKTTFSGEYFVSEINHFGNFRAPAADAWNTTINMNPIPKAAS